MIAFMDRAAPLRCVQSARLRAGEAIRARRCVSSQRIRDERREPAPELPCLWFREPMHRQRTTRRTLRRGVVGIEAGEPGIFGIGEVIEGLKAIGPLARDEGVRVA